MARNSRTPAAGYCFAVLCLLIAPVSTFAEVTKVTFSSRIPLAEGQSFGATGAYEKLVGRIEFAHDPAHPRNAVIVDLEHAPRGTNGLTWSDRRLESKFLFNF
jgi:hypothetical protein